MKKLTKRLSALVFAMVLLFTSAVGVRAENVTPDDGRWKTIKGDGYSIGAATKTDAGYLACVWIYAEKSKDTATLTATAKTAMADPHVIDYSMLQAYAMEDGVVANTELLSALKDKKMSATFGSDSKDVFWTISMINDASKDFNPDNVSKDISNDAINAKLASVGFAGEKTQFSVNSTLPGSVDNLEIGNIANGTFSLDASKNGYQYLHGYTYYYNASRDLFEYVGTAFYGQYGNSYNFLSLDNVNKKGTYLVTRDLLPDSITTGKTVVVDTFGITKTADLTKAIKDTIASTEAGNVVKVTVPRGTVVTTDVMQAAKDKGVALTLESSAGTYVSWAFGVIQNVVEFDPTVNVGQSSDAMDKKLASVTLPSTLKYTPVHFAFDGTLPAQAEVTLDLSTFTGAADGSTVYLYYYNPTTNLFEKIDSSAFKDGYATFTMTHCSDYIVTNEELTGALVTTPAPDTGDQANLVLYIVVMLLGVVAIAAVVARKKRA